MQTFLEPLLAMAYIGGLKPQSPLVQLSSMSTVYTDSLISLIVGDFTHPSFSIRVSRGRALTFGRCEVRGLADQGDPKQAARLRRRR